MSKFDSFTQFIKSVVKKLPSTLNDMKLLTSSKVKARTKVHIEVIDHLLMKCEDQQRTYEERIKKLEDSINEMNERVFSCETRMKEDYVHTCTQISLASNCIKAIYQQFGNDIHSMRESLDTLQSDSDTNSLVQNQFFSTNSSENISKNDLRDTGESISSNNMNESNGQIDESFNQSINTEMYSNETGGKKRNRKPSTRSLRYRNNVYNIGSN